MLRLVALSALVAGSHAATVCFSQGGETQGDCTVAGFADFCYITYNGEESGTLTVREAGCIPEAYVDPAVDFSKPGCNHDACWCLTDNCNTESKAIPQREAWATTPRCFYGIGGANEGATCSETPLYHENEYESPDCYARGLHNVCVENNMGVGQGDGCGDMEEVDGTWVKKFTDENSCSSYRAGDRNADDSFDGTNNHCRWIPPKDKEERAQVCEADNECMFYNDRGEYVNNVQQGNCEQSDSANEKETAWRLESGMRCEARMNTGCFENNDHMGENEQCTGNQDEESCVTESGGDFCQHASNGVCSGDAGCEDRDGSHECEKEKHQGEHHDSGPFCEMNDVYREHEFQHADCSGRTLSNMCVENNMHVGQGDGCGDMEKVDGTWVKKFTDENSCTSYRAGDRNADDSFDGTDNHCRWIPQSDKAEKAVQCEVDDMCTWYNDRGEYVNNVHQGNCEWSDKANEKSGEWQEQRGTECRERLKSGCFENNMYLGEGDGCGDSEFTDENSCTSYRAGERNADDSFDGTSNHCRWIPPSANPAETCATKGAGTLANICSFREAEETLTCSWESQCCQWLAPAEDMVQMCANNNAGTMAGMCAFNDGNGPPSSETVGQGFEVGLFRKAAVMTDKCAMIASFRKGKGSASAFGANVAGLIQDNCDKGLERWKDVAEHIGHDESSINEYCENFVPDSSAMAAFNDHSPSDIIAAAKAGNFATVFPGLADSMFIVTSKPEFGECLFTAGEGEKEFGLAICTCDTPECNNEDALGLVVDPNTGPMRLLQFIDGSLIDAKDAVNSVVDGLLDADGKINTAKVAGVTLANLEAVMAIDALADLTTLAELCTIVRDFQALGSGGITINCPEGSGGGGGGNDGGGGGNGDGEGHGGDGDGHDDDEHDALFEGAAIAAMTAMGLNAEQAIAFAALMEGLPEDSALEIMVGAALQQQEFDETNPPTLEALTAIMTTIFTSAEFSTELESMEGVDADLVAAVSTATGAEIATQDIDVSSGSAGLASGVLAVAAVAAAWL